MNRSKNRKRKVPVSVIIPMRNAETTVMECLRSVSRQTYPIREIIVVDNLSTDRSRELVALYSKSSDITIRLIRQKVDKGVAASYNTGVRAVTSSIVVFMTSDSALPTKNELSKLVQTLLRDPLAAASYSTSVLPGFIWEKYNFWEKYFAARMVDDASSLMVLKFDCLRRDAFLSVGGFDEINFGGDSVAGEDADLTNRLNRYWHILRSSARSYHLHYMAPDYSLSQMIKSRKMYARSYGRFLRKSALLDVKASILFLMKPVIALFPFFPGLHRWGILALIIFSFLYTKKMFITPSTALDIRIIFIPILNIFFVYYESFWIIQAFLSYKSTHERQE